MRRLNEVGLEWLLDQADGLTEEIPHISPVKFVEDNRYLPDSVTSMPGPMRFSLIPFMIEIMECASPEHPAREVNLLKGVQVAATTILECWFLYMMGHIRTAPGIYVTAERELADARIANNFLVMLQQSGFMDRIQSSDETSGRKSGKTKHHLQWQGGGYMMPFGANNANKARQISALFALFDEIDGWPDIIGKDGDPDKLFTHRCSAYWEKRKIYRASTPLLKGSSKIFKAFMRGDRRLYLVLCLKCGFPQELRWSGKNEKTRADYGFKWETEDGGLILESVRYHCQECGHGHQEHDKDKLFDPEFGAHWQPTATPAEPGIYSYKLPALYSPIGMQPWSKSVADYLDAFDPETGRTKDIGKLQAFYNNVLAEPFEERGSKVKFEQVSHHRRSCYRMGMIPNQYATTYSGGPVLLVTCVVDVHKHFLAVTTLGWCRDMRNYLIERLDLVDESEEGCLDEDSPVWEDLRGIIEEKNYIADDGKEYYIECTFIDSSFENDLVVRYCDTFDAGVYPVLGRERPAKYQKTIEFGEFVTPLKTVGYRITIDHYKDRLSRVLKRNWSEERGTQREYHFNCPVDTTDKCLAELTVETRRKKVDERGIESYVWYRPGNARNEMWDLLVYGHCQVEVMALNICVEQFGLETIDWDAFWDYLEDEGVFFS